MLQEASILATFLGPVFAVQAQKWIERSREERNRRLMIFQVLMATRAIRAGSSQHVEALNLIDLFFRSKSAKDKAVRDAWEIYLDFLKQEVNPAWDEQTNRSHNERGVSLLVDLLDALAKVLGYDFGKIQLKRGAYYPQGQADEIIARAKVRDFLKELTEGKKALPMAVVHFPVSQEAIDNQAAVSRALLSTLSGENPLKIKSEV